MFFVGPPPLGHHYCDNLPGCKTLNTSLRGLLEERREVAYKVFVSCWRGLSYMAMGLGGSVENAVLTVK